MMEWFDWATENPETATVYACLVALGAVLAIVLVRLAFAALLRRLLVGLGLRKRLERESPWASVDDRVSYKLRPAPRRWWSFGRKA